MSRSRVTLLHAEERWSGKKGNKGTGGCQMQSMSSSLTDRMIRAARLETSVYEEVEADPAATQQALWVVIIAAAAEGIGIAIRAAMQGRAGGVIIVGLILGIISALIGWIVWSYVTYFIGTRLFRGTATPGEMLRTIGFAQSPRVLDILLFIPGIGPIIQLVVAIWLLVAGIIAIRQALDFSTGQAIITAVIGWIALLIVAIIIGVVFGAIAGIGTAF
jgi:hypothetical protein